MHALFAVAFSLVWTAGMLARNVLVARRLRRVRADVIDIDRATVRRLVYAKAAILLLVFVVAFGVTLTMLDESAPMYERRLLAIAFSAVTVGVIASLYPAGDMRRCLSDISVRFVRDSSYIYAVRDEDVRAWLPLPRRLRHSRVPAAQVVDD